MLWGNLSIEISGNKPSLQSKHRVTSGPPQKGKPHPADLYNSLSFNRSAFSATIR